MDGKLLVALCIGDNYMFYKIIAIVFLFILHMIFFYFCIKNNSPFSPSIELFFFSAFITGIIYPVLFKSLKNIFLESLLFCGFVSISIFCIASFNNYTSGFITMQTIVLIYLIIFIPIYLITLIYLYIRRTKSK